MKKFILLGVAGLFVVGALLPESKVTSEAQTADQSNVDLSISARGACRQFINQTLNDPKSAKWEPGYNWKILNQDNGQWTVYPELRARNSFNAMVKATFECVVVEDGSNMRLVSLSQL